MNIVALVGNLAADPQFRIVKNGEVHVANFILAVENNYKKDHTSFPKITCFGKTADFVEKNLKKGRKVSVDGEIETNKYEGKNGTVYETYIISSRITVLDSKKPTGDTAYEEEIDTEVNDEPEEF